MSAEVDKNADAGQDQDQAESNEGIAELPKASAAEDQKMRARKRRGRRVSVSAECGVIEQEEQFKVTTIEKTPEELERIRKSVSNNFLFSSLSEEQRKVVFDAMCEKKMDADVSIIEQGGQGDYFYVLDQGTCDVFVDGSKVHTYNAGSSFGELALMYNCPRAATVKSRTPVVLWMLDRMTFRHILCSNQMEKRTQYETFLRSCPLFENLSGEEVTKIADVLIDHTFQPGEVVIQEGDDNFDGMQFYIIREGEAEAIKKQDDGSEVVVGLMGQGQFFGEKALIERAPRAATVRAKTGLQCASLDIAAFERLLGSCKTIMEREIAKYSLSPAGTGLVAARALADENGGDKSCEADATATEE